MEAILYVALAGFGLAAYVLGRIHGASKAPRERCHCGHP